MNLYQFPKRKRNKPVIITEPNGREFEVDSLNRWCFGNQIPSTKMREVLNGKLEHYKGYKARWA